MNDWTLAEQHADRAWRHYEAGRLDHALRLIKRALAIAPDQADWWFGKGLTLDAMQRYAEAAEAYRRVLAIEPDDQEALLHLASDLVRLDRPDQALRHLDHAESIDPCHHACRCQRIAAYAQLGQHDQAELTFYLAQQDEPNCPTCFDHIAHSLAIRSEFARAIWCWQRTLDLDPSHPQARANTARAYWYQGELNKARFLFERHLDEQPADTIAAMEFASLLLEIDELDQAEHRLNRLLASDPQNANAHHLLADLHLKRHDPVAASRSLKQTREIEPDRPGIELGLALAAKLEHDTLAQRTHLLAELNLGGQDARQVLELGRQLIDADLHDHAITLLTPMIDGFDDLLAQDDRALAEARRIRAHAMTAGDRHDQALEDCREAVRLDPDLTDAWVQLAHHYERTGQVQRAIVCVNHAIEQSDTQHADTHDLRRFASRLKRQALTQATLKTLRRAA